MRKLLILALLLAVPASASAATLPYKTAVKRAERVGRKHARQTRSVAWEISKGFRFERHKVVFGWYGQRADGSSCAAQLVVRYASTRSRKVVAYFRNQECG
jgi:phosphoheptose isomerase